MQAIVATLLKNIYHAFDYRKEEKIYEYFFSHEETINQVKERSEEDISKYEDKKVKSAILTDFILSIEIIIIALGAVLEKSLTIQIIVVSFIAMLATIGVYGIVALIVRMDDVGYKLIEISKNKWSVLKVFGETLVKGLPLVVKLLSVFGTIAMLLVAGGIYVHNIPWLHELLHFMPVIIGELLTGIVLGIIVLPIEKLFISIKKIFNA